MKTETLRGITSQQSSPEGRLLVFQCSAKLRSRRVAAACANAG